MENIELTKEKLCAQLKEAREEMEIQAWGISKTNEAVKSLYRELDRKNKELHKLDSMKTDFINIASHELRTPLTTIYESISQVLDGLHGQITDAQSRFLSICLQDVERLERLVNDILDISKIEAGMFKLDKEEADIAAIARGVVNSFALMAKNLGLDLKENFAQEKVIAYVDKDSIIRAFTNLIGNAFKFTQRGAIEISVGGREGVVECSVADSGKGIAKEDLGKVFGKFQQFGKQERPQEKGTGLGLNITKGIIDLHGGRIWLESELGKGTKFIFTLPQNKGI